MFIFRDYKNYDQLIAQMYNDQFSYAQFEKQYINHINKKYGINTSIGEDIIYLLTQASNKNLPTVFNKIMDSMEKSDIFQLQILFYFSYNFEQNERAKRYLNQMLKSEDELDQRIFFANLDSQYKNFFLINIKEPKEFIDFVEKAKLKWPIYTLEFNYLILSVANDYNITIINYEKYLKYCEKKFKPNRYFTIEDLNTLKK
ncbi:hypothetical protein EI427_10055 [Flammeovirga pectinis]|uniref:Uncharacterized protein n=1 Tax=Flammeovirga pectinis TaxID=2494373 RepID=A0A3S9P300_9BACT|nr:hypothetical protein [Flammeovirga pectinis]AZQ62565.1 hypothetical protein EI427_10055 [Flammeovirga pectinis]